MALAVFLLTFLTGQFAPRWSWVLVVLVVILYGSFNLPAPYSVVYWPGVLFAGELLVTYGSILLLQIYRYRVVYTPVQRQQTKWVVFGVTLGMLLVVLSIAVGSLVPGLSAPNRRTSY